MVVSACGDSATLGEPRVRIDAAYVAGDAAEALQSDGRFALPQAVVNPPGQLTEAEARAMSLRYVKDIAPSLGSEWARNHGTPVDAAVLAPCDRAIYAATPYTSLTGNLSEVATRAFGPHWVVPMCGRSRQLQIVVSFSALATELAAALGVTAPPPYERGDFLSFGVPLGVAAGMYSPEGAALHAFTKTGKRVTSVPELMMSPRPAPAALVRWRVDLEAPVSVRGAASGAQRERGTLFVGFGDVFKSSGLLDVNPQAEAPLRSWTDPVTRTPFTVVLSRRAPAGVELVSPVNP